MKSIFFAIFGLVALGFLGFGLIQMFSAVSIAVQGTHAPGIVTGYETDYSTNKGKTSSTTYLVVSFSDKEGHYTEFKSHTTITNTSHRKGSPVEVLYVPSNPKEARIDEFGDMWIIPIFTTIFGSIWQVYLSGSCGWKLLRRSGWRKKCSGFGR